MDFNKASFKEIEKLRLKATSNMKIGNREIVAGETIALFDKVQVLGLQQNSQATIARGGYNNAARVVWVTEKDLALSFAQGVFSNEEFALLTNAGLIERSNANITITESDELESDEDGIIQFTKDVSNLFIYKKATGEKLEYTYNSTLHAAVIEDSFCEVHVDYTYQYTSAAKQFLIGSEVLSGYLELEGRTHVKDDVTGNVVTGIIRIPRFKLVSNVSLRLGKNSSNPVAANFQGIGLPVGSRGDMYTWEFQILSDDIDSDF